jgi:transposase
MKETRRKYSSSFKWKIALEAIRGERTIEEISQSFEIHPSQIHKWKKAVLENGPVIFDTDNTIHETDDKKVSELERKVGQLVVENDFLRKNYEGWTSMRGGK